MANHTQQLLNNWYPQRDEMDWVLATIISTEGSSYRKPGAMMMINSLGQYHGLLSGGCLESDIMRQSRQCWTSLQNRIIQYDMREEEDIAWQLGIGCGGLVRILLQPINTENDYLQLTQLRSTINQNKACKYIQSLEQAAPNNHMEMLPNNINESEHDARLADEAPARELTGEDTSEDATTNEAFTNKAPSIDNVINTSKEHSAVFEHTIKPSLKLAIFGGGIDAIPVASIAANLGWHVIVADPRTGYAREAQFTDAKHIVKTVFDDVAQHSWLANVDAIVIMTHNLKLDAQALILAQQSSAQYVGMLGPIHRTERVLKEAGFQANELSQLTNNELSENKVSENTVGDKKANENTVGGNVLVKPLANPIGLRLGGELPESIALSILAEIHAFIEQADAKSISGIVE